MREITLQEMLDVRERRAFRQQALLRETGRPLISFCMNIPGPVKDSPLIRRGYREGVRRLDAALQRAGIPVSHREESLAPTGPELLLAADAEAEANRKISESLTRDLIDYNYAQHWDGKLPMMMPGSDGAVIVNAGDLINGD